MSRPAITIGVLGLVLVWTNVSAMEALEPQWISFNAAPPPPTELEIKHAKAQGIKLESRVGTALRGLIAKPEGAGPFPAVVMIHDCRGVRRYQHEWVRQLANWGYVALLVNSFFTRQAVGVCEKLLEWSNREVVGGRTFDAYGALEYLATLPYVDPGRIGVMGWAYAASLSVVSEAGAHSLFENKFKAAVAVSPSCRYTASGRFTVPVLVLAAGKDDWTLADPCKRMTRGAQNGPWPVELKVYADAYHGFDDPEIGDGIYLAKAYNPNKNPARGATLRYQRVVHEDVAARVRAFLARHLNPERTAGRPSAGLGSGDMAYSPTWVIDPGNPGDDAPPVGRSLFDVVFSNNGAYDLPFPFTRLIKRIEQQLPRKRSGYSTLKKVLIPLGRSLQRNTAAPEFFKYPRVIVAVDTVPVSTTNGRPILLKDRLFLGYQEKSQVIEVISYNESAARFEFQVVTNYGPEGEPQVHYARRAICTSCHQNAAPIFPKAAWDETNGNRGVAARLLKERSTFYGVAANSTGVAPAAIDNATDRANLFSAYQLLWRGGCGGSQPSIASQRCRAGAFAAMLQHRLGAYSKFDRQAPLYKDHLVPVLSENWRKQWPHGLSISNPNIPNREPLLTPTPAAVPPELDPLSTRAPLETWSVDDDLDRIIIGLSEFIPEADLKRLDTFLFDNGLKDAAREPLQGPCEFTRRGALAAGSLVNVKCRMSGSGENAAELVVDLLIESHKIVSRTVSLLETTDGTRFTTAVHTGAHVKPDGEQWAVDLQLSQQRSGRHLRLADGSTIQGLRIRWPRGPDEGGLLPSQQQFVGTATLTVMSDFQLVDSAIASMIAQHESPFGMFADKPFRGTKAMQELFTHLGLTPTDWCCDDLTNMPPANVAMSSAPADLNLQVNIKEKGAVRTFYRYCATCHRTSSDSPPNFLYGDATQVRAKLTQCAPRILFRLHMWQLSADARPKSPMPPTSVLRSARLSEERWRTSDELAHLKQYVTELMGLSRESTSRAEELMATGYENTPGCLPEPTKTADGN